MAKRARVREVKPEPPISPQVIERLTEVCEAIQQDRISCVAVAVVYRDGTTGSSWSPAPNISTLLGAIERMKHRLILSGEE